MVHNECQLLLYIAWARHHGIMGIGANQSPLARDALHECRLQACDPQSGHLTCMHVARRLFNLEHAHASNSSLLHSSQIEMHGLHFTHVYRAYTTRASATT